jgi:MFS family permease
LSRPNRRIVPRLLQDNVAFRRLWLGQAVSMIGDQVSALALPLTAVLALHATAGEMGALTTLYLIPNLLFSIHAGAWVDRRGGRRKVMLVTDAARALLVGTIPVAYALGHLTWTQLYIVSFATGSLSVLFYVAFGALFQATLPREDYVEANSLIHGSRAFSFLTGNTLGGSLVALLRGPYALALDAGSFVWSALFLARMHVDEPPGAPLEPGAVAAGARWIRSNAIIRSELLGVATINFFNFIFFALFVLYATRSLGVGPATLGVVLGLASLGAVSGSFLTGPVSRRLGVGPALILGCIFFPLPLVLVPAAGGPHWLVVALLFIAEFTSGVGLMMLDIMAGSLSAALIPTPLRSRVSGAFMVVNYGVRPLGTTTAGILGTLIGLRTTLWIATLGPLLGLLFLLPSPIPSLRELPEAAE